MKYENTVSVCCHPVGYNYHWEGDKDLSNEQKFRLDEAAEERARECINDGCSEGELNCVIEDAPCKDKEIRGWWSIIK